MKRCNWLKLQASCTFFLFRLDYMSCDLFVSVPGVVGFENEVDTSFYGNDCMEPSASGHGKCYFAINMEALQATFY